VGGSAEMLGGRVGEFAAAGPPTPSCQCTAEGAMILRLSGQSSFFHFAQCIATDASAGLRYVSFAGCTLSW